MDITDLLNSFKLKFGEQPEMVFRAPGRINLLGEHVDYNDGPVLPAAVDLAVYMAASANKSGNMHLFAHDLGEEVTFDLDGLDEKHDLDGNLLPGWALYPAGVAWALTRAGLKIEGLQAVYSSDVPIGAGLSSSAAVEMVFAVAWQAFGGWSADRMRLACICQQAENEYVGVASGLMDQFASAHGIAGHALYFDTRSLDWHPVPLPPGTVLVVADSGVRRSLTHSAYNERRAACEEAVAILCQDLPQIQSLRDVSLNDFDRFRHNLSPTVEMRAEHVVTEIERVNSAVIALESGDQEAFGSLMYAGHASLRDHYQVSTPELDILVQIAAEIPGCIGARLTGAGFGGCTINLVEEARSQTFINSLEGGYLSVTGNEAQVYLCQASEGASQISQ
jgi:galactokinase